MGYSPSHRFFVLGAARSGRAAAGLLAESGYGVTVYDDDGEVLRAFAESDEYRARGSRVALAGADDAERLVASADWLVLSPGVPFEHRLVASARRASVPVTGEIEVAFRHCSARIVGVTGTNGKSTVVRLVGDILAAAGLEAVVAGNIGTPFSEVVRRGAPPVVVLELSSFQLDTIDTFRADVAVLLNVTPDHLDRYGRSFAAYAASKARILNGAGADTLYVYNHEDRTARALAGTHRGPVAAFSSARSLDEGVFFEGGEIVRAWHGRREAVIERQAFTPIGLHNLENAMAAVAAALAFDVDLDATRRALRGYHPLPHRMELVRVLGGVAYVDDSKATNVDATAKSVQSVEGPVIVILGGRDKDGDFSVLASLGSRVRRGILIGEAQERIRRALAGAWDLSDAGDMTDAVRQAADAARPGDTVLLAPACASFDMFRDYGQRGDAFRACVEALANENAR
jgi:UDP-N-acetylmuramoylalanine--D-glutamate ligase